MKSPLLFSGANMIKPVLLSAADPQIERLIPKKKRLGEFTRALVPSVMFHRRATLADVLLFVSEVLEEDLLSISGESLLQASLAEGVVEIQCRQPGTFKDR